MKPSHNLDMGFETKKLADRSSLDVATMCRTKNDEANMRTYFFSYMLRRNIKFAYTFSYTHQSLSIRNVNVCNRTEL